MRIFIVTTDNITDRHIERFSITQIYARSVQAALTNQAFINLCETGSCGIVELIGEETTCLPLEWDNKICN